MDISQKILSDITVHMKYAKYIPELQRRETWDELVTRFAPFGRISEKSKIGVDVFSPKYDFINTLIASAHPSILSPTKYLRVLFGFGFLTSGNSST